MTRLALLALVVVAGPAFAQVKKSDSVVKAAAAAKPGADGATEVTLTLTIDAPWHIYANPVGNEDFEANATKVEVVGVPAADVTADFPKGKEVVDAKIGNYRVYDDKVEIKLTVKRAGGSDGPLQLKVTVQACDDSRCLPAGTITVGTDGK